MGKFSKKQVVNWGLTSLKRVAEMDIPLRAAYASYFLILSLFPALLLILNSLYHTNLQVEALLEILKEILPLPLQEAAEDIVWSTYAQGSGAVAGLSAFTALWSSSKGIYAVLLGLNAIYGVGENRGYFYTRFISVVYSVGVLAVIVLTLLLHVFGNRLLELLLHWDNGVVIFLTGLVDFRRILLLGIQSLLFTLMFTVLPNRKNRFLGSLPGGVCSALGWSLFSDLYSLYVEHFSGYASVYGSVYAISVSMLWLYFCMNIVFFGGAVNCLLERFLGILRSTRKPEPPNKE